MILSWKSLRALVVPLALTLNVGDAAQAQRYILDDGKVDSYLRHRPAVAVESGAMQAFTVPNGGTDMIESLSVVTTPFWYFDVGGVAPTLGSPITIAIWDDPNGDRDPDDAVLLGSHSGHTVPNEATGQFVTYAFSQPIPVSGSFFAGVVLPSIAPRSGFACIDDSQGYRWDSWFFSSNSGPVDLVHLDQNSGRPANHFLTGRFLLRANDGDYGDVIGTDSCLALPNSDGVRGLLAASGNLDAGTGAYRVHLTATYLPPNQAGFFLASQTQVPPRIPINSVGRICLGGTVLRIGPSLSLTTGRTLSWDVDLGNVDSYGAAVPGVDVVTAGQTWSFQAWHRDLDPGPTSNFSEAVNVTFQ